MKRLSWVFLAYFLLMMNAAFADTLTLPESITVIDDYAFYNCTEFTGKLVIPDTVTRIGAHAFDGCTGLTGTVVLPRNIQYVDETAFINTALTVVTEDQSFVSLLNYRVNDDNTVTITSYQGDPVHNPTIPDTINGYPVTEIGDQAFYEQALTGCLTLPETLVRIGEYAFFGCTGLTGELVLPDSIKEIGEQAFYQTSLEGTFL